MSPLILDRLSRHEDPDVQALVSEFQEAKGVIAQLKEILSVVRKYNVDLRKQLSDAGWKNDITKWGG